MEINYSSDGESGDDIIDFNVAVQPFTAGIAFVANQDYTVSLTANAAIRIATGLSQVADFPASNTLFGLEAISTSVLRWRGSLESGNIPYWMNTDGFDDVLYNSSELGLTVNIYGTPGSTANMVLPSLNNRFLRGSFSMANVSTLQGTDTHTHSTSSLYAQIEREGSAIVLKETGTISSWTPTDRVVGSSGAANSTPTRTVGTTLGGSLGSASHIPQHLTVKYIIKT
jgi:hypothetical protein